jgi:3-methyladenine DNA glycosylase/8-oxoguanine DNA glycosylase
VSVDERTRWWRPAAPVSLRLVLGVHRRGAGDPTFAVDPAGAVWRTARTPDGPGTVRLSSRDGAVHVQAWGPGADWLCAVSPQWLGDADDLDGFRPASPVLRDGARRTGGPRLGRSGLVWEALVPAILEQKVTGGESRRSWRWLVRRYGEPAPGPSPGPEPLRLVPDPDTWRQIPSWDWHRAGVGPQRAATVLRAAAVAPRLEAVTAMAPDDADARLRSVAGIGPWTSAEVRQRACGDADAVSVGDAHVPRLVVYALSGRVSDSDADMLAALEPYRGHRYRVQRLLELSDVAVPRFGPRYQPLDFRTR